MAIARKPRANQSDAALQANQSEREIEALIRRGGSIAEVASPPKDAARTANVVLRLPPAMLKRIDAAVETRRVRTPRHTWLLEAVLEKLEREADA